MIRLAEHFVGRVLARVRPAAESARARGHRASCRSLPLAGQRARTSKRDRAAHDHGAGRHDLGGRSLVSRACRPPVRRRPATRATVTPLFDARDAWERAYILDALGVVRRQHLAHGRRARSRAQQSLQEDAGTRHRSGEGTRRVAAVFGRGAGACSAAHARSTSRAAATATPGICRVREVIEARALRGPSGGKRRGRHEADEFAVADVGRR